MISRYIRSTSSVVIFLFAFGFVIYRSSDHRIYTVVWVCRASDAGPAKSRTECIKIINCGIRGSKRVRGGKERRKMRMRKSQSRGESREVMAGKSDRESRWVYDLRYPGRSTDEGRRRDAKIRKQIESRGSLYTFLAYSFSRLNYSFFVYHFAMPARCLTSTSVVLSFFCLS